MVELAKIYKEIKYTWVRISHILKSNIVQFGWGIGFGWKIRYKCGSYFSDISSTQSLAWINWKSKPRKACANYRSTKWVLSQVVWGGKKESFPRNRGPGDISTTILYVYKRVTRVAEVQIYQETTRNFSTLQLQIPHLRHLKRWKSQAVA
jgi:hypothetical protein